VQLVQSNGNINQTTTASQTYDLQQFTSQGGTPTFTGLLTNAAAERLALEFRFERARLQAAPSIS